MDWPSDTTWHPHRSEEHTSELQSPCNVVWRLLLEKKKDHFPQFTDTLVAASDLYLPHSRRLRVRYLYFFCRLRRRASRLSLDLLSRRGDHLAAFIEGRSPH